MRVFQVIFASISSLKQFNLDNEKWLCKQHNNNDFIKCVFEKRKSFPESIVRLTLQEMATHFGENYFSIDVKGVKYVYNLTLASLFKDYKLGKLKLIDTNLFEIFLERLKTQMWQYKRSEIDYFKMVKEDSKILQEFVLNY